jgi:hypothetical protein
MINPSHTNIIIHKKQIIVLKSNKKTWKKGEEKLTDYSKRWMVLCCASILWMVLKTNLSSGCCCGVIPL